MKLELEYEGQDLTIIWKFNDITDAASSIDKELSKGSFDDALAILQEGGIGDFNDYLEDLNGFKDSKIIINGDTFN